MEKKLQEFVLQLRRGQLYSSFAVAIKTLEIVRIAVSAVKWTNTLDCLNHIKTIGKSLSEAAPSELAIANVVKRVCYLIREAHAEKQKEGKNETVTPLFFEFEAPALYNMLGNSEQDYTISLNLKGDIMTSLDEFIEELKNLYKNIAEQATEHIHANEIVMTFGSSRTVEEFLKYAARKRSFGLVVAESAPSYSGQRMAESLSKFGIETTLISDSAVFAMMARINKVIIGTHAVMANGGLIGLTGQHMLCQAAFHHSVPVVVCTGLYKLCPLFPNGQDFNFLRSPSEVFNMGGHRGDDEDNSDDENSTPGVDKKAARSPGPGPSMTSGQSNHHHGGHEGLEELENLPLKARLALDVKSPLYDYIPPDLVSLYVTNNGGHSPSYIYRLLAEYYHPEDSDL